MREILFRGKTRYGEWVKGFLYITQKGNYEINRYSKELDIERLSDVVIPSTVGQYTGLTDKNGKKIFEGDIIKCKYTLQINGFEETSENICRVEWNVNLCKFHISFCDKKGKECQKDFGKVVAEHCEVIGNIHDNYYTSGDNLKTNEYVEKQISLFLTVVSENAPCKSGELVMCKCPLCQGTIYIERGNKSMFGETVYAKCNKCGMGSIG